MSTPNTSLVKLQWGVFDRRDSFDRTLHVAPCNDQGMIAGGHRVLSCDCQPRCEQFGEFTVVTHREAS